MSVPVVPLRCGWSRCQRRRSCWRSPAALAGAGSTGGIEARQFVRLGITVQVLVLRAAAIERPLPQLAQVCIDIAVAVVRRRWYWPKCHCRRCRCPLLAACRSCPPTPSGSVRRSRSWRSRTARLTAHGVLRARHADQVARHVVGQFWLKMGAAIAAAALPGGRDALRGAGCRRSPTVDGQRAAPTGQEVDAGQLRLRVVAERGQVGSRRAVIREPGRAPVAES